MTYCPDPPLYVSRRMGRSFWQEYRIYRDRVELQSWLLLHTMRIPLTEVQSIEVRPPFVFGELFRGKSLAASLALKIDGADLYQHVVLGKKSGFFKFISFTPHDPQEFAKRCKAAMKG